MSVSVSSRTWVAEGGYDGKGWTQRQIDDAGRVVLGGVGDLARPRGEKVGRYPADSGDAVLA